MRLRTMAALVIGALGGAACSLLVGTDGLTGRIAPPPESGVADTGPPDTASGSDASVCSTDAAFCDDFDQTKLGERWTRLDVQAAEIGYDTDASRSPPNALRIGVRTDPTRVEAMLMKDLGALESLRCSFSVRADLRPASNHFVDVLRLVDTAPNLKTHWINLGIEAQRMHVREDLWFADAGACQCPIDFKYFAKLPDAWVNVTFETDFKRVTVAFDGLKVLDTALAGVGATSVELFIGASYNPNSGDAGATLRVDDLVCTFTR